MQFAKCLGGKGLNGATVYNSSATS